jgi:hypothetical protein
VNEYLLVCAGPRLRRVPCGGKSTGLLHEVGGNRQRNDPLFSQMLRNGRLARLDKYMLGLIHDALVDKFMSDHRRTFTTVDRAVFVR